MKKDLSQGKDWNEGGPDHEGEMAVAQLHRIAEMSEMLLEIIGENDELPGWIEYKISRAFNDMNDAFNYMEAANHMGDFSESSVTAEGKEKRGLWYNIHQRRKKGLRPKRPGEKGYPKTLKIR